MPYPESPTAEPDYPESSGWYGERVREPERYEERGHREPERYDETRREPPRPAPVDTARMGGTRPSPGPVSGPPPVAAPAVEAPPPVARRPAVAPGSPGPATDSLYRSKRPALAGLFWGPALLLEIPALLLLVNGLFGAEDAIASSVTAGMCLMIALPLLATGLYAVATGAVRAAGPNSIQAWLRPPVAYVTVGILLVIAAGLAA